MILKSFNSFIAQPDTVKPINEAKEKFKISQAKASHTNSQGAFTVKYVGPGFDMPVMIAYLQSDPISAPAMQKVKANPAQYFFIYKTLKDNQQRFLAGNSRIWVTYLELIDAKDKDGNMLYVGFDKPPYNNFVKWNEVDRLINKQDPHVVQAGKKVIGAVNNVATQEINKGITDTENAIAKAASQTQQQQPGQGLSDAEKSVMANAQQMVKGGVPGANSPAGTNNPQIDKLMDSLRGLSVGARGQKVDLLQNTIQKLADATKNTAASTENQANIRANGLFDDIYREHTEKALQLLLGLDKMPDHGMIDQTIVDQLKKMLAANPSITAQDLLTSNNKPRVKPNAQQPAKPAQPVNKPAAQSVGPTGNQQTLAKTNVEAQSTMPTSHEVQAPFGTIRW